jgi:hypothetical protein
VGNSITVDTENATATVQFDDDKGNPTEAPSGAVATFSSDTPSVLTIGSDPSWPLQGDLSPVGLGTANVSVTFSGTALDGSGNAIPDPDPIAVTVGAGAAAEEGFTLSVPSAPAPVDPPPNPGP